MQRLPLKVLKSLDKRKQETAFRELTRAQAGVDFSSNDYLGFAGSAEILQSSSAILGDFNSKNGAGGSRLLTGNHPLYAEAEKFLSRFHRSESALIFNSGYDANLGLLASLARRGDLILYDELVHASIRDGISLSLAKSLKFRHNNQDDLKRLLEERAGEFDTIYVVTESVFSMDGDMPPLKTLVELSEEHGCFLIVDEAHATGVFGAGGQGFVQETGLEDRVFARVITFGKALGAHGAAVLGNNTLRDYLINFARSFIYTTGLPPHSVATVLAAYHRLEDDPFPHQRLHQNIEIFRSAIKKNELAEKFITSRSPIQSCIIPGNDRVKSISRSLQKHNFDVRPILSPTVAKGEERLRFCLHAFNSEEELKRVVALTKELLQEY